jgi:hypothetical protein
MSAGRFSAYTGPTDGPRPGPGAGTITARPRGGKQRESNTLQDGLRVVAATTDPVRLGFLGALLRDAGIGSVVLDAHISAIEGGIGAFPRRLAVAAADEAAARAVLREAGEEVVG